MSLSPTTKKHFSERIPVYGKLVERLYDKETADASPWPQHPSKQGEGTSDYLQFHKIDALFNDLKAQLERHLPKNPLLFLRNVMIHKEAELRDRKTRRRSRKLTTSDHHSVVLDFEDTSKCETDSDSYASTDYADPDFSSKSRFYSSQSDTSDSTHTQPTTPSTAIFPEEVPTDADNKLDAYQKNTNMIGGCLVQPPPTSEPPISDFTFPETPKSEAQTQHLEDPNSASTNSDTRSPASQSSRTRSRHRKHHKHKLKVMHVHLSEPPLIGMDIGGTLCKICFFEPRDGLCSDSRRKIEFLNQSLTYGTTGKRDEGLSFDTEDGRFHFINFETRRMNGAIMLMNKHDLFAAEEVILATGGGAFKFAEMFKNDLNVSMVKGDELSCLLKGLNFLLEKVPDECYYYSRPAFKDDIETTTLSMQGDIYPYILVNIGSGVSILRVDSANTYERVSGTCIGGGTYWGLCRLLTKMKGFDEATTAASKGDSTKVDMLVSDIYGGDYEQFGLKGSVVASAFGKMVMKEDPRDDVSDADIARALVNMIGINVAQLAYLCAMRHKVTRIMFVGNFLRQNPLTQNAISFSVHYWSQGVMKAMFLKHEGYFGSVGAYLLPCTDVEK